MSKYDQELLTFAAKAIAQGLSGTYYASGWNPLDDDGDCARLESALMLSLVWGENEVSAAHQGTALIVSPYSAFGGDRNEARRRASVNAAALIGRAMP